MASLESNAVRSAQPESTTPGDGVTRATLAELLALRLEVPRVRAGDKARAGRSGRHLSNRHARGIDYAESRPYQPGDDVRVMDWRVMARSGKPHTKLFLEERERNMLVLLDCNRSMEFATRRRFKSVQAARAAALLAWLTIARGDRLGLLCFGQRQRWVRPRGGRHAAAVLAGELLRTDDLVVGRTENLGAALRRSAARIVAGSRVLVISDGFSCDDAAGRALARLQGRADLALLLVSDPLESRPLPRAGGLALEQASHHWRVDLGRSRARKSLQQALGEGRRRMSELAGASQMPCAQVDTEASGRDLLAALSRLGLGVGAGRAARHRRAARGLGGRNHVSEAQPF